MLFTMNIEKKYQVISGDNLFGQPIRTLGKEEKLAIGIMDTGTVEELENTIEWYSENFNHGLHVITYQERLSREYIQKRFPKVVYIIFNKAPSLAQRLNAFANECLTNYFYVTRSDVETCMFDWQLIENKMRANDHTAAVTPLVFNQNHELIPTLNVPHFDGNDIEPLSFQPSKLDDPNLYPFLGLGLYDRALFQRMRGLDEEIRGAYWQVLDFGTRCWLYGYNIFSVNYLALVFPNKKSLMEDRSPCIGMERFYTKALCVNISRSGKAKVHRKYKTDKNVMLTEVQPRASLYKTDFQTLCDIWKMPSK